MINIIILYTCGMLLVHQRASATWPLATGRARGWAVGGHGGMGFHGVSNESRFESQTSD